MTVKRNPSAKVVADERMLALITRLAKRGARERGICHAINVSGPTWRRMRREDPRVVRALERGVEAFHDRLVADVLRMSEKNNVIAPIFLLRSRFGYQAEDDPAATRPQIVIHMRGALTPEAYEAKRRAIIEHEPPAALPAPIKSRAQHG